MRSNRSIEQVEPILRWAGGKRQILSFLIENVPPSIQKLRYFEPFLGAGSLFFALSHKRALLSDANQHLIATYLHVATYPDKVHAYLNEHLRNNCEEYYYRIRTSYNNSGPSVAQASRFIYLNKACFNGIFRVNRHGEFNVPYGWKEPPALPSLSLIRAVSKALSHAKLKACSYQDAIGKCRSGDFVYLDPPYPPLNGTAYFTHYTSERFGASDQDQLASTVSALDRDRVLFMMTNADTPLIRRLYKQFNIIEVPVIRYVTCKSKKHVARELIIRNY